MVNRYCSAYAGGCPHCGHHVVAFVEGSCIFLFYCAVLRSPRSEATACGGLFEVLDNKFHLNEVRLRMQSEAMRELMNQLKARHMRQKRALEQTEAAIKDLDKLTSDQVPLPLPQAGKK